MSKPKFQINLSDISQKPGVYMFMDAKGRVIYVGKAKNLRNRLSSYFNAGVKTIKTEKMLTHASNVKTIVTENEVEAFLLEANLIKTEMPKYNILLKDSKGYPYVKLTNEEYPRLIFTRQTNDEEATYFGPFVNVGDLKHIIEMLLHTFPLRTCSSYRLKEGKICLKYQIKKCSGPCENLISHEDYMKTVKSIKEFFKGNVDEVKDILTKQMKTYASNLAFEEAGKIRDRILSLDKLFSKQSVSNISDERNIDVFYKHSISGVTGITQIFVRSGKMIGVSTHFFDSIEDELLERFIMQFYSNTRQFPEYIALAGDEYDETIEEALTAMAGKKVHIRKRGIQGLIDLAKNNAELQTESYLQKVGERKDVSKRLADMIKVEQVSRVECIDISHLGGNFTVGVSVAAVNGELAKQYYRKYKIKTAGNDDFQSMCELFLRKGENIAEGSEEQADLYIIDGGLGQLNSAIKAAEQSGITAPFISISKSRSLRPQKHEFENTIEQIHLPNRKNPVIMKKNDPLLHFIQHLRDESHRFAITYSRSLALKNITKSPLLQIEGMGEKRLKQLLTAIPDIHTRKDLTVNIIKDYGKIPKELAEKVLKFLEEEKSANK